MPTTITVDDRFGQRRTLSGQEAVNWAGMIGDRQIGGGFGNEVERHDSWHKFAHYRIDSINRENGLTAHLTHVGDTIEARVLFKQNADGTMTHSEGWPKPREANAYYVVLDGPTVQLPNKNPLTKDEFWSWVNEARSNRVEVEITDHQAHLVTA